MTESTSHSGVLLSDDPVWGVLSVVFKSGLTGLWFTVFLCGTAVSQAYYYFNTYMEDGVWLKVTVVIVTSLNVLHSALVFTISYHYTTLAYMHDPLKQYVYWTVPASVATFLVIATTVLFYFTRICYQLLSGRIIQKPIAILIAAPILLHVAFSLGTVVHAAQMKSILDLAKFRSNSFIPMLSCQVAADTLVSLTLCLALPKPVYKRTRGVIQGIMVYTVSRGIITSAVSIVQLIALNEAPNSTWFMAAVFVHAGLYTNSFLSSLNIRGRIGRHLATRNITVDPPQTIPIGFHHTSNGTGRTSNHDDISDTATGPNGHQGEQGDISKPGDVFEKV